MDSFTWSPVSQIQHFLLNERNRLGFVRMEEILFGYEANSATWLYYSLLLILAVFFKFNRLWSLRNLDLVMLLCISPGMIWVKQGEMRGYFPPAEGTHAATIGYGWLFFVSIVLLFRLLSDGWLKRRPRLEQNMNVSGMSFLVLAAFCFISMEAITEQPPDPVVNTVRAGKDLIARIDPNISFDSKTSDSSTTTSESTTENATDSQEDSSTAPPTTRAMAGISNAITDAVAVDRSDANLLELYSVRTMAILAHLAVITGLIFVGRNQFGDIQLGVAMGLIYLLIPCTAYNVHRADHVIPAALLVWAIAAYRKPVWSGALFGLACGAVFFPVFLLPIWVMYYRGRGAKRFLGSLVVTGAILVSTLILTSADSNSFQTQLLGTIDWQLLKFGREHARGFWVWNTDSWWYRLPVFVCFMIMVFVMTFRTGKRDLEQLIANSTAIIVGTQFWYSAGGGKYVLWYLPLLLLVVFRPRLTHLVPPELASEETEQVKLPPENSPARRVSKTGAQVFR